LYFTFVNPGRTPSTIRMTLFDRRGNEKGFWEQILPAYTQRRLSLAEIFNSTSAQGAARIWSDAGVNLSVQRVTRNLNGDLIENELGYIDPYLLEGENGMDLPYVAEGEGIATEIMLLNHRREDIRTEMFFTDKNGNPRNTILR